MRRCKEAASPSSCHTTTGTIRSLNRVRWWFVISTFVLAFLSILLKFDETTIHSNRQSSSIIVLALIPKLSMSKKGVANVEKFGVYTMETIPGAIAPLGIFDPLKLGYKADENTLKRYREAELIHGRVAMLATIGFLVGEEVEGTSFLFNSSISGPAISHPFQVPILFWLSFILCITKLEIDRANDCYVEPWDVPYNRPGLIRVEHIPGDIQFDPFNLKPKTYTDYISMQNKELQNGRLAMIASSGFLAQEAIDHKGIIEHLISSITSSS